MTLYMTLEILDMEMSIERIHSSGQALCKFFGTKETFK